MIYSGIPANTTCTVRESIDGHTSTITVDVTGSPDTVTIPANGAEATHITDTYTPAAGSLLVRKTIDGPAAGQQGDITIHTVCGGNALTSDFVIGAGASAGDHFKRYDGIPAGTSCTVTETADGHTSAVSVAVVGSGRTVSVPAGHAVEADISDTYGLRPGQLEVIKTITGPLAGEQGKVVIQTVCNGTPLTDFVIPAGTPGGDQSHIYSNIPAPADCVVTDSPQTPATIPGGGAGAAHITDTYGPAPVPTPTPTPGSLRVTKTITGPAAGHQGAVTIHVECNGTPVSPNFVILAHTAAGNVSHSFDNIPVDSVCTVTETVDGATSTVTATVSGNGQQVTVPGGEVAAVSLMDAYQAAPGSLRVIKDIRGPAARRHGHIAILVACGGPLDVFAFLIPAHRSTGSLSRRFDNIPAGARCTVIETAVGRSGRVIVAATGRRHRVTIRAHARATTHLFDTFRHRRIRRTQPVAVTGGLG
jgi:hypothetical protein